MVVIVKSIATIKFCDDSYSLQGTGKTGGENLSAYLGTILKDIKNNPLDFLGGISIMMGIGEGTYWGVPQWIIGSLSGKKVDRDSTAYYAGKVLGNLGSMIIGLRTIATGLLVEGIGGGLDLTGIGAILGGIELNVAGAMTVAYGGSVVVSGSVNMQSNLSTLFSKAGAEFGSNNGSGKPTSKTFGQPIETTIGGTKVKLRVDAEPDANKIQIQAGHGKDSIVDVRIDPTMPLEPQIPKNLNLSSGQKQELLKYLQKAVDFLNN
jgi:hypothetical protein